MNSLIFENLSVAIASEEIFGTVKQSLVPFELFYYFSSGSCILRGRYRTCAEIPKQAARLQFLLFSLRYSRTIYEVAKD